MSAPDPSDLARDARRAAMWSGVDGGLRALAGFAFTVVLARLLAPEAFGVVAVVAALAALAGVVADAGLSTALIQRQDTDASDASGVFQFNLAASLLLAMVLVLAAPSVAGYFRLPEAAGITRLMAANLVLGALGSVHMALLLKELAMRDLAFIGVVATVSSGTLAVFLAWSGFGTWSLAWQVVASTAATTALAWWVHPWRPRLGVDIPRLWGLLGFGGSVMAANVVDTIHARAYALVIGKVHGPAALGFYTRAHETQQLPAALLARVLSRVALPLFARTATAPVVLRNALAQGSRLAMFLSLPAMAGLAAVAHPLVEVVFGPRWLPAAPLLQVLCLVGALWPVQVLNVSALLAQGRSRRLLELELAKKGFALAVLAATAAHGLQAIVLGQALAALVAFVVNAQACGGPLGLGAAAQARTLAPSALSAGVMAAVVWGVERQWTAAPWVELAVLLPLGLIVYLAVHLALGAVQLREFLGNIRAARG